MLEVRIDNQEKKTPKHIETLQQQWALKHPGKCKDFRFVYGVNLIWGDILCNDNIAEVKWGSDLESSLKNKKIQSEILGMKEEFPFLNRWVITAPGINAITAETMAWLFPMLLETNTGLVYAQNPVLALDKYFEICRNGKPERLPINSDMVLEGVKKLPGLIKSLSCLFDGFSLEFAAHFVHPTWACLRDVIESVDYDYVLSKTSSYYKRNMNDLNKKILKAIQG